MSRAPHILVVDDEPGIVRVLCAVLEDAGYHPDPAGDGRAALERARASVPDLVLLDYLMPHLDGRETLRAIRKEPTLAKLPVVMMSGVAESIIQRKCQGAFDAFLRKPFGLDDLLDVIARLLPSPRKAEPRNASSAKRARSSR